MWLVLDTEPKNKYRIYRSVSKPKGEDQESLTKYYVIEHLGFESTKKQHGNKTIGHGFFQLFVVRHM